MRSAVLKCTTLTGLGPEQRPKVPFILKPAGAK